MTPETVRKLVIAGVLAYVFWLFAGAQGWQEVITEILRVAVSIGIVMLLVWWWLTHGETAEEKSRWTI